MLGTVQGLSFWKGIWKKGGSAEKKHNENNSRAGEMLYWKRGQRYLICPICQKKKKNNGAMTQLLAHLHRGKTSAVRTLLKWVDMAWHELMAGRWSQINSNRKHSTIFITFFYFYFFFLLTTETNYWGQRGQQPGPKPGSVFSTRVITEISAQMRHAV